MVDTVESPVPVKELLEVESKRPAVRLCNQTAHSGILTVVHVHQVASAVLLKSETCIECECEVLEELDLSITVSVECVTLRVVLIENGSLECIRVHHVWTSGTGIHSVTIVIHIESISVSHHATHRIPDVKRIDRCDIVCDCEDVTSRSAGTFSCITVVVVEVCV